MPAAISRAIRTSVMSGNFFFFFTCRWSDIQKPENEQPCGAAR